MVDVLVHEREGTKSIDDYFVECKKTPFGAAGKYLYVHRYGDAAKPPIVFVHDIGFNHDSCFRGFLNHLVGPDARFDLFRHFSVVGIDLPGCHADDSEADAAVFGDVSFVSLAEDIETVLVESGAPMGSCFGFGVGIGASILTLQALQSPVRYQGLVLLSPSGRPSTWLEAASFQPLLLALRTADPGAPLRTAPGTSLTGLVDTLVHYSRHYDAPDARRALLDELGARSAGSVLRLVRAAVGRPAIEGRGTEWGGRWLRAGALRPRVLLIAGEDGYYYDDTVELYAAFPPASKAWLKLKGVGAHAHEEVPGDLLQPLKLFFNGFGYE